MPLGNHCTIGKRSIFLLFSLGKKTNPCRLGCNIHKEQKNNNMGMTKEAVLAADFDSVIGASLQLLILDSHAAILYVNFTKCEKCYKIQLLLTPFTKALQHVLHLPKSILLNVFVTSHKLWGKKCHVLFSNSIFIF